MALDLSNWMGQLEPIMGNQTLLDLSLPGAHDTLSFDLSNTLSDGYLGIDGALSDLLHTLTPLVAGSFIRSLGQTQGLNITSLLDAGVRFVDLRIMYTGKPDTLFSRRDWYSLHGCQSQHRVITHLQHVRRWLDEHPKEILVFWVSRHGGNAMTGTDQYPATTAEERQVFFESVKEVFQNLMFDASLGPLKDTSVATMWKRGCRVVWYAADFVESTNSSKFALDAMKLDNIGPGDGASLGSLRLLRTGAATLARDKAADRFFIMSLSPNGPWCQQESAALLTYLPLRRKDIVDRCVKCLGIPGMEWCPVTLQDMGQLSNYYNQIVLDTLYNEGETNEAVGFPNAIYIDDVDTGGLIRTGVSRLNPLGPPPADGLLHPQSQVPSEHQEAGFAFSATMVGATVRRLCRRLLTRDEESICGNATQAVNAARQVAPVRRWDDVVHGRRADWPPVPSMAVV
uniref:Phosphatidylinositol-specific phospholipase C X domain-containing protein n=1 Tax=Noctiluca scintillans TaxID=2966 RepID=A0A7S1FDN4_NOCSC